MTKKNRDFKGFWMPKSIWLDTRLNCLEKVILVEINSLDMGEEGCWASNQYLAEFCQCSETRVSTAISKLIKYGYIYVKSFNGRSRILKSNLSGSEEHPFRNCNADLQKTQPSNTNNNINNNTMREDIAVKCKHFAPPTLEEVEAYCLERKNNVDPKKFFDYYSATDWCDKGEKKLKSWKQKIIKWELYSNNKKTVEINDSPNDKTTTILDKYF